MIKPPSVVSEWAEHRKTPGHDMHEQMTSFALIFSKVKM
jgi:hypothetical protein